MTKKLSKRRRKILEDVLRIVIPKVVKEWNNQKLAEWEHCYEQDFESYFKGMKTQEITKTINPLLYVIFLRHMMALLPEFVRCVGTDGDGLDYRCWNIPLETKITLSDNIYWTGNGYPKTPLHILIRFNLTELRTVTGMFVVLVDLDRCVSDWTDPVIASNWSTIKFFAEDATEFNPIVGKTKVNQVYIKPQLEGLM